MTRSAGGKRSFFLLGDTSARVRACLGRPARHTPATGGVERWQYGRSLEVTLRRGRVEAFALLDGTWHSAPDRVRVGSPLAALGRALGPLVPRSGGREARATVGGARVRVALAKGRATRVEVRR